jgi:hypothetical protein
MKPSAAPTENIRRLTFFRRATAALLLLAAVQSYLLLARWIRENPERVGRVSVSDKAPAHREVARILRNLRYSGLAGLLRPEVRLTIDFPDRTWSLRGLHRFDERGQALLDEGRFGACGQLAIYMHQKIQPLFDHRFRIRLVRAAESGFFPPPRGTHFVLTITDITDPFAPKTFVLDPAFRRYGPVEDFEDYVLQEEKGFLSFVTDRGRDETHPVNHGTPLFIRNQAMLGFAVRDTDGRLDPENYSLALSVTRKHKYYSRPVLLFRKKNGQIETLEDPALVDEILKSGEYARIKKRLFELFLQAGQPG